MTERVTQRRPNGTGSLRQRRDGRWEYRVVIAGRQRSFYGRTEADALSAPERAPHSGHDAVTVAAFMSDWVAGTRQSMRPNTYLSYESAVRVHINPALGGMRLTELRPAHVVRFRDHLSRRVNPTTTRRVLVTLGTGLQTAVDQRMVASNAARAVRKPRIADPNRIILSRDAAGQLLAAARGDRLEALYRLALSTGMRLGELLALRWEDVDLDQRLLHVTGDATEDPGGRPTRIARSAAEQRSIMLTRSTVRVLARTPRSPWLVFPTARGTEKPKRGSAGSSCGNQ